MSAVPNFDFLANEMNVCYGHNVFNSGLAEKAYELCVDASIKPTPTSLVNILLIYAAAWWFGKFEKYWKVIKLLPEEMQKEATEKVLSSQEWKEELSGTNK